MPDDYKTTTDLDMIVQTNLDELVIDPYVTEQRILFQLGRMLNNGRADWRNRGSEEKPYAIDLYEEGKLPKRRVDAPHLQVYPTLRKDNAVEVPLDEKIREWILRDS